MEENGLLIVFGVIAILAFMYFVIKRNRKDQKDFEKELNEREVKPNKHGEDKV
ncbi:MAG: hypothetical protein ACQUHE_05020 [Bacteroidia bacterium]